MLVHCTLKERLLRGPRTLVSNSHVGDDDTPEIADLLQLPASRELHEITNILTMQRRSLVFARIVEQGIEEGVFDCARLKPFSSC